MRRGWMAVAGLLAAQAAAGPPTEPDPQGHGDERGLSAGQALRRQGSGNDGRAAAGDARRRGEAFLAENAHQEGVVTLPSGLQYRVLRAGAGPRPTDADRVVCHYRGTLIDGTEFDSSYRRGRPATFEMARVIPGWREALRLMPAGSRWQVFVPSALAYGERGLRGRKRSPPRIGPHATLILETELLGVRPGPGSAGTKTAAAEAAGLGN